MIEIEHRFPFEAKTFYNHEEVVSWLEINIGQFDCEWYRYGTDIAYGIVAGAPLYDHYRFRTERSAILFVLRWSQGA